MSFGIILTVILVSLVLITGAVFAFRIVKKRRLFKSLEVRLLLVRLPQKLDEKKEKKDVLAEINDFAQLLGALATPKAPFVFEVAVHNVGEDIHFYLAVPKTSIEFVSRQIQGLWPGAQVGDTDEYTIFNPGGSIRAGYLKQKRTSVLPIRTYADAELDTFAPILSSFSKLKAVGEGLALQIIAVPASRGEKNGILKAVKTLKKGGKMTPRGISSPPAKKKRAKDDAPPEPVIVDEETIKLLTKKISKPLFRVNIRLLSAATEELRVSELFDGLSGGFNQFAAPLHNEFKLVTVRNPKNLAFQFSFRQFSSHQSNLLSSEELASLFHFPTSAAVELPNIKWTRGRQVQPPLSLPKSGTPIGESLFRDENRPVYIQDEDRRRHVYIIGQTGTGKSTLMKNMIVADIAAGKGVALIDPHGDLVEDILGLIPKERAKDVIIFDPGDIERPLGLNMLENNPNRPEERTFIVNEMQGIFNKLFSEETMGPMFEQYMRNALLLLMEDREELATLTEVPRVFTDIEFRKRKLTRAKNPTVIDFWEKEAIKAGGEASLANMTPYITSKFNNFIANDYVRPIIGQQKSAFNFREVMDKQLILLVNLSKGRIGDINAGLLGMVIVGKILMAALSRVDMPQELRKDYNLYIDEFQNFTTDSIATILSEARKYRLNLVIAHQFIAQLEEKIRDAVFGNVGSQIAFRVGAEDTEVLVKQFEPIFSKNDLINIDNFSAYAKLLVSGQTTAPFNIRTYMGGKGDSTLGLRIKEFSRLTYGKDRDEVEANVLRRLRT